MLLLTSSCSLFADPCSASQTLRSYAQEHPRHLCSICFWHDDMVDHYLPLILWLASAAQYILGHDSTRQHICHSRRWSICSCQQYRFGCCLRTPFRFIFRFITSLYFHFWFQDCQGNLIILLRVLYLLRVLLLRVLYYFTNYVSVISPQASSYYASY